MAEENRINPMSGNLDKVIDPLGSYLPITATLDDVCDNGSTTDQNITANAFLAGDITFNITGFVHTTGSLWFNSNTSNIFAVGGGTRLTVADTLITTPIQLVSTLAIGTSPFAVTSTTVNTNLNADLLDGLHGSSYLTAEVDTLDTVCDRGSTTNQAITLTSASPQLTLGTQNSIAGGIKFWDNDSINSVTLAPAKHSTASYTVQFPDGAAGTHTLMYGTWAANQIIYGGTYPDATSVKSFTVNAATPSISIGDAAGSLNPSFIFNQQVVGANKIVTFRASALTTANVTYSLPSAVPTATQLMTMTTGGLMGYHAATANQVQFATSTNVIGGDADFTFLTDTLTVTKIAAFIQTGNQTFADSINMVFNTTTGTKIGTGTTQKIGFWNQTPAVQQAHIIDADGTLADITTKFNNLLLKLETIGILATA